MVYKKYRTMLLMRLVRVNETASNFGRMGAVNSGVTRPSLPYQPKSLPLTTVGLPAHEMKAAVALH